MHWEILSCNTMHWEILSFLKQWGNSNCNACYSIDYYYSLGLIGVIFQLLKSYKRHEENKRKIGQEESSMQQADSMDARKCVHAQEPYLSQAFAHESSKVGGRGKREEKERNRKKRGIGKREEEEEEEKERPGGWSDLGLLRLIVMTTPRSLSLSSSTLDIAEPKNNNSLPGWGCPRAGHGTFLC